MSEWTFSGPIVEMRTANSVPDDATPVRVTMAYESGGSLGHLAFDVSVLAAAELRIGQTVVVKAAPVAERSKGERG